MPIATPAIPPWTERLSCPETPAGRLRRWTRGPLRAASGNADTRGHPKGPIDHRQGTCGVPIRPKRFPGLCRNSGRQRPHPGSARHNRGISSFALYRSSRLSRPTAPRALPHAATFWEAARHSRLPAPAQPAPLAHPGRASAWRPRHEALGQAIYRGLRRASPFRPNEFSMHRGAELLVTLRALAKSAND
jgi:hypothetical protein